MGILINLWLVDKSISAVSSVKPNGSLARTNGTLDNECIVTFAGYYVADPAIEIDRIIPVTRSDGRNRSRAGYDAVIAITQIDKPSTRYT